MTVKSETALALFSRSYLVDKQTADAISQMAVTPSYKIHLSQATYRAFEAECNLSGLDHDEMIISLLHVYVYVMPNRFPNQDARQ